VAQPISRPVWPDNWAVHLHHPCHSLKANRANESPWEVCKSERKILVWPIIPTFPQATAMPQLFPRHGRNSEASQATQRIWLDHRPGRQAITNVYFGTIPIALCQISTDSCPRGQFLCYLIVAATGHYSLLFGTTYFQSHLT